jgi:uncharacterized protein YggE
LSLLLTALAVGTASAGDNEVVVAGTGVAVVRTMFVTMDIFPSALEDTADDAIAAVHRQRREIIDALATIGIQPEDLEELSLNVQRQWEKDNRGRQTKFLGYRATLGLRIRFDRADMANDIMQALGKFATSRQRIQFHAANPDSSYREALASAVRNARSNAEAMVGADGSQLGDLVGILSPEHGGGRESPAMNQVRGAAVETTRMGNRVIRVTVRVRYKIDLGKKETVGLLNS